MKNFVANDVTKLFPSDESFDALASIVNFMNYAIIMAKKDGQFAIWNKKACEILGKKKSDIGAENWSEHYGFHDPETKQIVSSNDLPLVKAMKGYHVEKQELLVVNETVKDIYIICDAGPIVHNGEIMGGVVVFRDITKERQLEIRMKDMLNNLEDLGTYQNNILERITQSF